jgi:hypothetical protein
MPSRPAAIRADQGCFYSQRVAGFERPLTRGQLAEKLEVVEEFVSQKYWEAAQGRTTKNRAGEQPG